MSSEPPRQEGSPPRRGRVAIALSALAVVAVIALLAVGLAGKDVDRSIDDAIAKGDPKPAPNFALPLLANGAAIGRRDGEVLRLSDLRGRAVVLNFWASWCDPCRREAPALEAAWQRAKDEGGVVLGLDVQDLSDNALAFVREFGQTYPHVRDKGDGTYEDFGLTGVPETFFIDRQGRVRVHWVGEIDAEQIDDGLDLILDAPR